MCFPKEEYTQAVCFVIRQQYLGLNELKSALKYRRSVMKCIWQIMILFWLIMTLFRNQ